MRRFASARSIYLVALGLLSIAVLASCSSSGSSVAPISSTIRKQLFVDQQPTDVVLLKSIYENFQADQMVTVAGRIYAQGMSPFDAKESVFTIMELPKPGHNHEDPGDCPFCLHELKNAKMAIVRVVDSTGKLYPQPADKLLGLTKNTDIVVQGKASQVGDTIVIELQSLHLLQDEASAELSKNLHSN